MTKKNDTELKFKKPSLQRKIIAWLLILALAGSAGISALAILFN